MRLPGPMGASVAVPGVPRTSKERCGVVADGARRSESSKRGCGGGEKSAALHDGLGLGSGVGTRWRARENQGIQIARLRPAPSGSADELRHSEREWGEPGNDCSEIDGVH